MATGDLKGEFVNRAYSFMRISGITKQPTSEELDLALQTLESMAAEWDIKNICVGYNFEDEPDASSKHGIIRAYWLVFPLSLANILLIDKGKTLTPELARQQSGSYSNLITLTAADNIQRVQPSNTMPVGSGNERWNNRLSRFFKLDVQPEPGCDLNEVAKGDIDDYVEPFNAYLEDGEAIASFTIDATTGLTIISSANSDPNIDYRIEATGGGSETVRGSQQVKIVVTTDSGRVTTRLIDFFLVEVEINGS